MERQAVAPTGSEWRVWTERVLLFLGAAQIVAGIFFFFAYNWDDLSRWQKLGTTQAAIVAAALGARFAGLDSVIGKVLLLAAGALVGVNFAVYGQVYQTGADAFDLFANWAAVIFGWVLIAHFAAFWILWAVIVNVAVSLYLQTFTALDWAEQAVVLGLLNGGVLVLHEAARPHLPWLVHPWSRRVAMGACLAFLALGVMRVIDRLLWWPDKGAPLYFAAMPAFLVAALGCYLWSRGPARDLVGLFLVVLSTCAVTLYAASEALQRAFHWDAAFYLIMAVTTLAIFGLAGWWLHRAWQALHARSASTAENQGDD